MGFLEMDMIAFTGHFNRIPFPFRMLRYYTAIHNLRPVPLVFLGSFQLISEETNYARLHERIWFIVLIGVDPPKIQKLLEQFRVQKTRMNASFSPSISQDDMNTQSSIQTPPVAV